MKLKDLADGGFVIKAWTISTVKDVRYITLLLTRQGKAYTTATPISYAMLKDAEFITPIEEVEK